MKRSSTPGRWGRRLRIAAIVLAALVVVLAVAFSFAVRIDPPDVDTSRVASTDRVRVGDSLYRCGKNWLRLNRWGLWELYVEGDAFDRGLVMGRLSRELVFRQEKAFVDEIHALVPSRLYLSVLRVFVAWFNRGLDTYVPEEYKKEIYGVSLSASDQFEDIGPAYQRILNYHAAHDIGHALQGMHMVGCTSFGVWNESAPDSMLLIGRNFDFSAGEEFSREKIVCFMRPTTGHKFMMVTWGGMVGAVSGMNDAGLTITLNAAQSEIPSGSATPISLIAREILQYAANIREAYAIANRRQSFVSESILIGSLQDKRAAIIEKTPSATALYEPSGSSLICSNHFQGDAFRNSPDNQDNLRMSSSLSRYQRVQELLGAHRVVSAAAAAAVLRDQKGVGGADLGMSNERAINQLIAHHSVIFEPGKKLVWVSTHPYQLGAYVAYDLDRIFGTDPDQDLSEEIIEEPLTIPPDTFLTSGQYKRFVEYRRMKKQMEQAIASRDTAGAGAEFVAAFVASNPEYFGAWSLAGDLYREAGDRARARACYQMALNKEIASMRDRDAIVKNLGRVEEGAGR